MLDQEDIPEITPTMGAKAAMKDIAARAKKQAVDAEIEVDEMKAFNKLLGKYKMKYGKDAHA